MMRIIRAKSLRQYEELDALLDYLDERLTERTTELISEHAEVKRLRAQSDMLRAQRNVAIEDTETIAAALTAESLAFALYRARVTGIAGEIAGALSAAAPAASIREVARLLLKHSEALGIDPQRSADVPAPNGAPR
ncbi:hypothetical protein ACFU99_36795 [Streptomyces sp. NPDC057654]|uniref:hypothetical protein n=1 Tax=Streptomyces sp. NPDC057654 TaxID=3346196 RepID=UPI0036B5851E